MFNCVMLVTEKNLFILSKTMKKPTLTFELILKQFQKFGEQFSIDICDR